MSKVREQILAALAKFQPKAIEIPELGGTVFLRPLTVAGMARVHAIQGKSPERMPSAMLIDCVLDEDGKQVFSAADEDQVNNLPGHVAGVLLKAIEDMSEMSADGTKDASGN